MTMVPWLGGGAPVFKAEVYEGAPMKRESRTGIEAGVGHDLGVSGYDRLRRGVARGRTRRPGHSVLAATCVACALWSSPGFAQSRADIGLLGGWSKPSDEGSALQFNFGTVYEASFAKRILASDRIDVAVEVPLLAANSLSIKTTGAALPREYAALFLTPGIRLMIAPRRLISVFGALGGGFASYEESARRADGGPNPGRQTNSTGAVSFGGGVDVRGGSWLGLRGEARDVVTGARRFSIATPGD